MKDSRFLLIGAAVLLTLGSAPAVGQETNTDTPPKQKYLSDITLKHEKLNPKQRLAKESPRTDRRRARAARPWPGPDVAYEVQPWTDGAITASGWCFALDPEFAGLGRWVKCAGY